METESSLEAKKRVHFLEEGGKHNILRGAERASSFIKKVVAGKKVRGKKYSYDSEFILEIHRRMVEGTSDEGILRRDDTKKIRFVDLAHWYELPTKMYLFGQWFSREMANLSKNPEALIMALEVAAATHYGLVSPEFHPFENGNGRTARALMNTVLMSQSYELTAFRIAIPPVPMVRDERTSSSYIASLVAIDNDRKLSPLMTFIAHRWRESLEERLGRIYKGMGTPKREGDKRLIAKLERRLELLTGFIAVGFPEESKHGSNGINGYHAFTVPDYFTPKTNVFSNHETL